MISCKHCGGADIVKDGLVKKKQRYQSGLARGRFDQEILERSTR